MADLFQTTINNITLHISNIFKEKELDEISVGKESLLTASDGKKYKRLQKMEQETIKLELIEWLTKLNDLEILNYLKVVKQSRFANHD